MGCSASTLDTEQSVARCKSRKHFIKQAVAHRHAFAAAHAAYIQSLKNTGAAIRQFGEGEANDSQTVEAPSNVPNPQYLPPPMPDFLAPSSPIARAASMPPLRAPPILKTHIFGQASLQSSTFSNTNDLLVQHTDFSSLGSSSLSPQQPLKEERDEEDDSREADESLQKEIYDMADAKPPPMPVLNYLNVFPSTTQSGELAIQPGTGAKVEARSKPVSVEEDTLSEETELPEPHDQLEAVFEELPVQAPQVSGKSKSNETDLNHVLQELDDQFLAAFESGKLVAKLLEARKMHYHFNLAGAAESDHSKRVLRVMSWDRNTQLLLSNEERYDIFHSKEKETHASTLDKLLAWEKKLHDEVKTGELIRRELERKSDQLRIQKKRENGSVSLSKTKTAVKSLQTRYLVEIQAVDAAASEIDKLRDNCLHGQLVDLVKGSMAMWDFMCNCHHQQYKLIEDIGTLDSFHAPTATHEFHYKNTHQLECEINLLHTHLDKLVATQKEYMNSLYHWLRLHIIQIESDGKDAPGSPQKMTNLPVYDLCKAWLSELDKLPGNVTLHTLKAFSSLIQELISQQTEEIKQRRKLEMLRKELERKEQTFKAQEVKHNGRRLVQSSADNNENEGSESGNLFKERERALQLLRDNVEIEREKYEHMCSKSGSMTLSCLEKGLPPVLHAIKDFSYACCCCYRQLHILSMQSTLQISHD